MPENGYYHNNLAIVYFQKKNYRLAIQHCDRALELGARVHPDFLKEIEPYRKEKPKR